MFRQSIDLCKAEYNKAAQLELIVTQVLEVTLITNKLFILSV